MGNNINEVLETIKYSWSGALIGIIGALFAWIGGKTYSNASLIVDTKLICINQKFEECVKKEDYKEDMQEVKTTLKDMYKDIKDLIKQKTLE